MRTVLRSLLCVLCLAAVAWALGRPWWLHTRTQAVTEEITRYQRSLARFKVAGVGVANQAVHDEIETLLAELNESYNTLTAALEPAQSTAYRGPDERLYVRESLFAMQKRLGQQAASQGVDLPADFGFGTELPPAEAAPLVLRQVELVDAVVTALLDQGASIALVRALPFETDRLVWIRDVSVEVQASLSADGLVKALYRLASVEPPAIVRSMQITRGDGTIDVGLTVSWVMLVDESEALPLNDAAASDGVNT